MNSIDLIDDTKGARRYMHKYSFFIENFKALLHPKNKLKAVYDSIAYFVKNGCLNAKKSEICDAFKQAFALLMKKKVGLLIGMPTSEKDIKKAIQYLSVLLTLENAFDTWYEPISIVIELKKCQKEVNGKDTIIWYFEQDTFQNFFQKNTDISYDVYVSDEEYSQIVSFFEMPEYDSLVSSNEYLRNIKHFINTKIPPTYKQNNDYVTKAELKKIVDSGPNNFFDTIPTTANTSDNLRDAILSCRNWASLQQYLEHSNKNPTLQEKHSLKQEMIALQNELTDKIQIERLERMIGIVENWRIE